MNREEFTKFANPPRHTLLGALRSEFENGLTLGALSWVALPSRCPPYSGLARLARLPIEVRLRNGFRARCRLDEFWAFVEVFVYREYDALGVRWDEVRTILDVGANVGAATLWFASRAPHAAIVAVEPASAVIPSLIRNVKANGLERRVAVFSVALGGNPGVGRLETNGTSLSATVVADSATGGVRVPVWSLSQVMKEAEIDRIDVLKLDCEGSEFDILLSSDMSLLRLINAIVGEFHPSKDHRRSELEQVLVSAGFECRFRGGEEFGLFSAVRAASNAPERSGPPPGVGGSVPAL